MIIKTAGRITDHVYLIDTHQFGIPTLCACFIYWDGTDCVLMDVGTSDDVLNLLHNLKQLNIPLRAVRAIIPTHYHFDHMGGAYLLWREISKENPHFKIMVSQYTHEKLQNSAEHMRSAATTFGNFVGTMEAVPESAYSIVKQDSTLPFDLTTGASIQLVSTPGHSLDHSSPTVFMNQRSEFTFLGEAAGTLFHSTKLVSVSSTMPNFRWDTYYQSFSKLIQMDLSTVGFSHFGVITGRDDIRSYLIDHLEYMQHFRQRIVELFRENPSTRYIIENTNEFWANRIDFADPKSEVFQKLRLALTYGMMIDLGLRQVKYEHV